MPPFAGSQVNKPIAEADESQDREEYTPPVFYDGLYAPDGFDIMKILVRVASRPNPRFELGNVDWSAAIILCDTLVEDTPIVYCSDAFEKLTGYGKNETVGRNCRFLQKRPQAFSFSTANARLSDHKNRNSEDESQDDRAASEDEKDDSDEASEMLRLRSAVAHRQEVQALLRNYKRCGTAFMNLLTVIPIRWDSGSDQFRYLVGFQADRDANGG